MNLSVLHISDLHRDSENPIGNKPLLDSLENDRRRYATEETPKVRPPDIIIVSGDIVYGVKPGVPDADQRLKAQYSEALGFLNELTSRFLDGDKGRVVIVPGNHDVSASHFIQSLRRIEIVSDRRKELVEQFFSRNSVLRWSWPDFELFEIIDFDLYAQRLRAFSEFYRDFYEGYRDYFIDSSRQFDIFDFPEFNLTIVGFCSCYNNDIFNKPGDIHPDCISGAGIKLQEPSYQGRLRIAVWHHNTEGLPLRSDYMDPDILQNLIDRGFSLGFHGHQHRPQFIDTRFRHQGDRHITVISAGTLCGGPTFRFGRAYNIVQLDTQERIGSLHLRETLNDNLQLPIWGRRPLPPDTGGYIEFRFDPPPEPVVRIDTRTVALIEAQKLHQNEEYGKAAAILVEVAPYDGVARRLLLDCFWQLRDMVAIIRNFDPPKGVTESIYLIEALWIEGMQDRLRQILNEPLIANSSDPSLIEMRNKYAPRLRK